MHIWGTYVHKCTKYKVYMSNPGEVCTDDTDTNDAAHQRRQTMHDMTV